MLTPQLGDVMTETWRVSYGQSVENASAFIDGVPVRVVVSWRTVLRLATLVVIALDVTLVLFGAIFGFVAAVGIGFARGDGLQPLPPLPAYVGYETIAAGAGIAVIVVVPSLILAWKHFHTAALIAAAMPFLLAVELLWILKGFFNVS